MNEIWNGDIIAEEWKTGMIVPLYKKGTRDKAESFRGIFLMDSGCKIFAEVSRNRLRDYLA